MLNLGIWMNLTHHLRSLLWYFKWNRQDWL